MRIIMVDDSVPFDGDTLETAPLGGMEKAFVNLARAFAGRGHEVQAFTRCAEPKVVDDVVWRPLGPSRPDHAEVLIASRRPSLLAFVDNAEHRFLWAAAPGRVLQQPINRNRILAFDAHTVLQGRHHASQWDRGARMAATPVEPGLAHAFTQRKAVKSEPTAIAVATGHPAHGLQWLIGLWLEHINPIAPKAELHLYSAILHAAESGGDVGALDMSGEIGAVRKLLPTALKRGVRVKQPLADKDMAAVYRGARVHLHAGHEDEMYCSALAESQAIGLPAVARPRGAARDRIRDGQSGFIAGADSTFATAALKLLNNDDIFRRMSSQARLTQARRTWAMASGEFEALWAQ